MTNHQTKSHKGFSKIVVITTSYNLICFAALLLVVEVKSSPPGDPIKCYSSGNTDCTITNAYATFPDRSICRAPQVFYPSTEEELISVIANATSQKKKMKIATSTSHSVPKLSCPDGEDDVLISTKYLNKTARIDPVAMTITVESGMILRDLINVSATAGLAIPHVPYWWGLTVGGILGTGSHGSSLWGLGSCVHDYVIGLRIVSPAGADEGYAKVRTLEKGDPELDAVKVSLGVLGVISQVTLRLEPLFKRSISYVGKNDSDIEDQVSTFGKEHEFGDIMWLPSQNKVVYRIDDRVSPDTPGNGLFDFLGFRSIPLHHILYPRTQEESEESAGLSAGKCAAYGGGLTQNGYASRDSGKCEIAQSRYHMAMELAYGLTNDGTSFTGYPVVGYNNRLQSSGLCFDSPEDDLQTACNWDPRIKGFFFFEIGISISLSNAKNFIQDVKKLVALQPEAFCGIDIYTGILMRYVKGSSAYLGKDEDSLEFDIIYYRSKDPMTPRLHQDFYEELVQIALFQYGGVPHWGKNNNMAFAGAINKYKNSSAFLKVKQLFDPLGLFSNEWTDQILGLKDGINSMKEGCALEGLCICEEDIHCAPKKGYFCRPGKIYKNARVCAPSLSNEIAYV
ncbi:OLC1v1033015C1 [Oldenlandia corymbosa var. corymbosa]|uniref:L-gulonolactone oxidase n=1 Tax=Oldenlandia corymbosa var. corymbosa TaxID=529605 RepID=A0AAV1CMB3_OLDCO|nr:OLC1v1033015C1 [Oldenlandia corymbosa var. corymbosa]